MRAVIGRPEDAQDIARQPLAGLGDVTLPSTEVLDMKLLPFYIGILAIGAESSKSIWMKSLSTCLEQWHYAPISQGGSDHLEEIHNQSTCSCNVGCLTNGYCSQPNSSLARMLA